MENENKSIEKDEALTEQEADISEKKKTSAKSKIKNKISEVKEQSAEVKESIKKKVTSKIKAQKPEAEKVADTSDAAEETADLPFGDDTIDAPALDSLLLDNEEITTADEKEESRTGFEEFLADYKAIIGRTLAMAKGSRAENDETQDEEDAEGDPISEEVSKESTSDEDMPIYEASFTVNEQDDAPQFTMDIKTPEIEISDDNTDEQIYNPEKPRIIDTVFDFAELFIFTLAAVLFITTFFFKHTIVEGGSMMNTLQDGEHLIISDLFYTPERGDIIVFADYSEGQKSPYVKRVIGIAGDKVKVDETGNVTVNGEPLDESEYVYIDGYFPAGYEGKEYTVKDGEVFVLGDHRNASYDSASFPYTAVKVESILGKVLLRIYPFEKFGLIE